MSGSKPPALLHVDCDGLWAVRTCYGQPQEVPEAGDPFWLEGIPEAVDLFREFQAPGTFFVVSNDVTQSPAQCELAKSAIARGHEIACHSLSHEMNMSQWTPLALERELRMAKSETEVALGTKMVGFRAPGFSWRAEMAETINLVGFEYDSSVFASPWGAPLRWLRRRMGGDNAVLQSPYGSFEVGFGAREPHRLAGELLEIPVSLTPTLRLPAHASFGLMRSLENFERTVRWHAEEGLPFVWLLHLIDLCDTQSLDLPVPGWAKKSLCRSGREKREKLRQMMEIIQRHFEFKRTDQWVRSAFHR